MTADDIIKTVFGVVLTIVVAAGSWILGKVLGHGDASILQGAKIKELEAKVEKLEKSQMTTESVREVVEKALEKRDASVSERRTEFQRVHMLEMRTIVGEELEKLIPRIIREIRGNSGLHGRRGERGGPPSA